MAFHVGVSGAYRNVGARYIGLGGVWRPVDNIWIGVSGVWRHFYAALKATLVPDSYSRKGSSTMTLSSDGNLYANGSLRYAWCTTGDPAQAEVRATLQSGTFASGTFGSWLSLGTSRTWDSGTAVGTTASVGTALFEIRNSLNGEILASAIITLVGTP